jgi:hypothetical protein
VLVAIHAIWIGNWTYWMLVTQSHLVTCCIDHYNYRAHGVFYWFHRHCRVDVTNTAIQDCYFLPSSLHNLSIDLIESTASNSCVVVCWFVSVGKEFGATLPSNGFIFDSLLWHHIRIFLYSLTLPCNALIPTQRLIKWGNIQLVHTLFCPVDQLSCQMWINNYNYSYT